MIKFRTSDKPGEKQLIGLGLSQKNLEMLAQSRPILINGSELGLDQDIVIFWGKTEADILNEIRKWFVEDFESG